MRKTIIIIHEIYGITENLKKLSKELEAKGYRVILPSLFLDNYSGDNEEYSYKKYFTEVGFDNSISKIDKIIEKNSDDSIVLIGFSVGATLAWMKSNDLRIKGIIGFYGSRIRNNLLINPLIPTKLYFCNEATFEVDTLIDKLRIKNNLELTKIKGDHGFYSKLLFNHDMIQETNKIIFNDLDKIYID